MAILHLLVALAMHFRAPIHLPEHVSVQVVVVRVSIVSLAARLPPAPPQTLRDSLLLIPLLVCLLFVLFPLRGYLLFFFFFLLTKCMPCPGFKVNDGAGTMALISREADSKA